MSSVTLQLPDDQELIKAAGCVALAHGQLELMLRMTIKTLAGATVQEALDATARSKNWELREEIKKHFNSKTKAPDFTIKVK